MSEIISFSKHKLMRRFFDLRGKSAISNAPTFKFGKVVWGRGFVSNNNGTSTLEDIPDNVSQISGEFYRNDPVLSYVNGVYTIYCAIEKGDIPKNQNHELTTLYLLDGEDNIITVMTMMPITMHSGRSIAVEGVITEEVTQS